MPIMAFTLGVALALAFGASPVSAGLEEIDHVVLFMQENRAFNHVGTVFFSLK
jgi:phospholipase C